MPPYAQVTFIQQETNVAHDAPRETRFLQWLRQQCQNENGKFESPVNTVCLDMHQVSGYLISYWLKLASHANSGALIDVLQTWALADFANTVLGNSESNAPGIVSKTEYTQQLTHFTYLKNFVWDARLKVPENHSCVLIACGCRPSG